MKKGYLWLRCGAALSARIRSFQGIYAARPYTADPALLSAAVATLAHRAKGAPSSGPPRRSASRMMLGR
jgi:hypothetical protein